MEITVERVADGEVPPFLLEEARVGDTIELRGLIDGYFTRMPGEPSPLLPIAGGSGIAPLMTALRQRALARDMTAARLLIPRGRTTS